VSSSNADTVPTDSTSQLDRIGEIARQLPRAAKRKECGRGGCNLVLYFRISFSHLFSHFERDINWGALKSERYRQRLQCSGFLAVHPIVFPGDDGGWAQRAMFA